MDPRRRGRRCVAAAHGDGGAAAGRRGAAKHRAHRHLELGADRPAPGPAARHAWRGDRGARGAAARAVDARRSRDRRAARGRARLQPIAGRARRDVSRRRELSVRADGVQVREQDARLRHPGLGRRGRAADRVRRDRVAHSVSIVGRLAWTTGRARVCRGLRRTRAARAERIGAAVRAGARAARRGHRVRRAGVRRARRLRADSVLVGRRADRGDSGVALLARREPVDSDAAAVHAGGLRARREQGAAPHRARVRRVLRQRPRRSGDRHGARLHVLHVVHRRIGHHDSRARRPPDADSARGEVQREGRARSRHRRRLARHAVAAMPPAHRLRHCCAHSDERDVSRRSRAGALHDGGDRVVGRAERPAACGSRVVRRVRRSAKL